MLTFNKPEKLNGTTLLAELLEVNLTVQNVTDNGEGLIYLDLPLTDKAKAQIVIDKHQGLDTIDPKVTARASALAKLAALGLSADEIAAL